MPRRSMINVCGTEISWRVVVDPSSRSMNGAEQVDEGDGERSLF